MAFFIKYEFWYNYLHILKHRNVPTYSVSSIFRRDQVFFKPYGKQYSKVLKCFTRFFVQNEESRRLLAAIGIKQVDVMGDTRFDRVLQIKQASKQLPLVEAFVGNGSTNKVFVAGSSWLPDEQVFIPFFNQHKDWKLIIAPHVIDDDHLDKIAELLKGRKVVRYTKATMEEAAKAEVLIVNCFGLLSSIYRYGQVAYVGGGFGVGIHNVLEAAVWNVPVLFGPNNEHFQEAQALKRVEGGFQIDDDASFARLMTKLMEDEVFLEQSGSAAGGYVKDQAGASGKIMRAIGL